MVGSTGIASLEQAQRRELQPKDVDEGCPRVAILTSQYLPYSQTFIHAQVGQYRRYEPDVFARARRHADQFPASRIVTLTPGGPFRYAERLMQWAVGYSPTFLSRLRARGHVLLHPQFGREGLLALPLQAALNVPLIVTFRGRDLARVAGRAGMPHPWLDRRRRRLFAVARRILAVSHDLADELVSLGAPGAKVQVWHGGIRIPDEQACQRPLRQAGEFRVLMAGRLVEKKGFADGLRACAAARDAGIDVWTTIVGDGPQSRSLARLVADLRLGDRVTWRGAMPHADLLSAMSDADLLLAPSLTARDGDREGVPNVIKEASARGKAVLATRHGGIPEAVDDGVTGMLVAERDVSALARSLIELGRDPARCSRYGVAGRHKMMREFDLVTQVAALEALYDTVLDETRR